MKTTSLLSLLALIVALPAAAEPTPASLPPDAAGAAEALADSPRHGEWVDVLMPDSEVRLKTWVVYPERRDPAPVVIVIHEIFGLTDWVRGVADALAAEGFIAIAPDMLSGMGPDGGGTESLGENVRAEIRKLTPDACAARLDAVRDYALKLPAANGRVGCVGFCWGGSTSFAYAARQPDLHAAVVYYGSAPDDRDELEAIACPILGLYGGDDARVTSTVQTTARLMAELAKPYTTHIYAGAGHGFLRQQSGRAGANLQAAKQAWTATLVFFREHLEADE